MRKLILALIMLCFAQQAVAQQIGGFNVPSDLLTQPGGGYSAVTTAYETDPTKHNISIDASVNPAPQTGLPNIPIPTTSSRIAPSTGTTSNYCQLTVLGGPAGCTEAKFRTLADFQFYAPIDPIRNFNQAFSSHLHCFFGAGAVTPNATYKSLRTHSILSAAAGTDTNGTGYWFPCIIVKNRDGDGKDYVVKLNYAIVYYVKSAGTTAEVADINRGTLLVPGLRYVFGYNMDSGTAANRGEGSYINGLVTAANAAAGSNRYSIRNPGQSTTTIPGGGGYNCSGATPSHVDYLKTSTGGDPFNGTCNGAAITGYIAGTTLTVTSVAQGTIPVGTGGTVIVSSGDQCTASCVSQNTLLVNQLSGTPGGVGTYTVNVSQGAGSAASPIYMDVFQQFWINISGADCWDRTNLWSDSGYKHLIPRIYDNLFSEDVCPKNYSTVPSLSLEFHFTQYGWADRQRWQLSSDAGRRTALGGDTATYPDGFSFHTDWMHGWDQDQMSKWQKNCNGMLNTTPHQCSVSQIDATERLVGGFTGEAGVIRTPQVNIESSPRGATTGFGSSGWGLIPSTWNNNMSGMHFCPGTQSMTNGSPSC